ncbi:interferon-induced 35 kDa protein homolog [Etheostoma cragini]|uniref:interferon-induced 35 kDa protein homolog n=1 Tax=Etheostoma cragini TaxID=417921 RepID=UPI00155F1EEC|nr:interferon-induced 35 kDa protein homolog [Etheostoma cragini]
MSSDEDFSLVSVDAQPSENTLEGIKASITRYKKKHEQLIQEQQELAATRDDQRDMTEKFKTRSIKLIQDLKEDQRSYKEKIENGKAKLNLMKQEESELLQEIQMVEEALKEEEAKKAHLKQQSDVFTAVPERKVVFTGSTESKDGSEPFEMKPRIVCPMEGGTVLITFEEEVVAKKILDMKQHWVDLGGECSITVEARPVQLMLPTLVEIDSEVSNQHVLVSNLPKMDTETLLNKLEIHFSKSKHGGGEVECCEMLPDSGTVVITFVDKHIARGLTDTEHHDVKLQEKTHRVRLTPFLNGKITNLKTKMSVCPRTVLLTGIPNVMERETLQDLLEIHFQKIGNGGGEVEAFLYNPLGQHTSALFDGVSSDKKEE